MRVAAFLFTAALVGCAAGRPPAEHPRSGAPEPGPDGYTCSAQQSFQTPPTDAELKQLETACARRGARVPAGVREVNDCPCTQLAAALGYRKDAAARRRGMTLSMQICEAGSYDACDAYELARSLCLRDPSQPECGPLRDRGLIPTTPLPLSRVLGCRAFDEGTLSLIQSRNPQMRWVEVLKKGYLIIDVDAARIHGDFFHFSAAQVGNPDYTGSSFATAWMVASGVPNMVETDGPLDGIADAPPLAP